jgi:hypothetical protein
MKGKPKQGRLVLDAAGREWLELTVEVKDPSGKVVATDTHQIDPSLIPPDDPGRLAYYEDRHVQLSVDAAARKAAVRQMIGERYGEAAATPVGRGPRA